MLASRRTTKKKTTRDDTRKKKGHRGMCTNSLVRLNRPSDIWRRKRRRRRRRRLSCILLDFHRVNHKGKQQIYAEAIVISKWRWSRLMPFFFLSFGRLEYTERREEHFNSSWHTDALILTFFKKKRKREKESADRQRRKKRENWTLQSSVQWLSQEQQHYRGQTLLKRRRERKCAWEIFERFKGKKLRREYLRERYSLRSIQSEALSDITRYASIGIHLNINGNNHPRKS